jgi:hypothetical protein
MTAKIKTKASRKKSLIEKTSEPFQGMSIAYSPVNQAWFVLFGRGPVHTRSVVRIVETKKEALAILRHATSGSTTNDPNGVSRRLGGKTNRLGARRTRLGRHARARVGRALARKRVGRDPSQDVYIVFVGGNYGARRKKFSSKEAAIEYAQRVIQMLDMDPGEMSTEVWIEHDRKDGRMP